MPAPARNDDPDDLVRLAERLDCLTDRQLQELANVSPITTEQWRKRRTGPDYVLLGNRVLYPRDAIVDFMRSNVRVRREIPPKALL